MTKKYNRDEDVLSLVRSFEKATIARDEWKHAEHLIVALYYLRHNDLEAATAAMRAGLFKLLTKGFGVDLAKEMPYHETLTVFWMQTVSNFNKSKNGKPLVAAVNELTATFDKDYPLRYYSRDYLFSDAARAAYVGPDLEPID